MYDNEVVFIDFDNVIYYSKSSSSALEEFLKQHPNKKAKLFYPAVFAYMLFTKAVQRVTQFKTGESTVLAALDIILEKHPIKYDYVDEFSKEAAKNVPRDIVDTINKIQVPKFVITSEPVDLVKTIIGYAGIEVDKVYGNEFEIIENKIHGFKRYMLDAGMSGKYFRAKLLLYEEHLNPERIYAIGDSIADRGINGYLGVPVVRYEVHNKDEAIAALEDVLHKVG